MILDFLKFLLALALVWPRGYLLVYIIDRSKSFSFGFKFFTGWIFGLAAFTLDIFAANALGGFKFDFWIFFFAVIGQIVGFELLIFILEKKIIWPDPRKFKSFYHWQKNNLTSWSKKEKIVLIIFLLAILIQVSLGVWLLTNTKPQDLFAEKIFLERNIFFNISYPLNDKLSKVWLAVMTGNYSLPTIVFAALFYYLIIVTVFYFSLPQLSRYLKLFSTYLLSLFPLFYFVEFDYSNLVFSILLFITVSSIFFFLTGRGNSFFYLSGISLAFGVWTKSDGLVIIFPLIFLFTLFLFLAKKIRFKQLFFYWFWPVVTIWPWLSFIIINRLNIFSNYFNSLNLTTLTEIALLFIPLAILFLTFFFHQFSAKIKV